MTTAHRWARNCLYIQEVEAGMCLAIPGKVLSDFEQNGMPMAKVQFGGIVREACLEYVRAFAPCGF
jgi:hypothetical protein